MSEEESDIDRRYIGGHITFMMALYSDTILQEMERK